MRSLITCLAMFSCLSLLAAAQEKSEAVSAASAGSAGEESGTPVIGPEDTISILVLGAEELSKDWRVSSSGELSLPQVGTLAAAGLTADKLQQELQGKLQRYYVDPQVSVHIVDFRSQPVIVSGAVEKPGIIQLKGAHTLFEALVLAGGPRDAGPTVTVVRSLRNGPLTYPGVSIANGESRLEIALKDVTAGSGAAANLRIQAHDVISVSTIKQPKLVQVIGEVNHPGAIELVSHDSISVVQAIAIAGGLTRNSKNDARMIHVDGGGNRTSSVPLDLKKIMAGRADNYRLGDGDIVIVASSQLSAFIQAAGLSAVTTGVYILSKF